MKFDKSKVCVAGLHDVPVGTKGYCANTMTQLESRVVTEYESDVCTICEEHDGYYCVRGKEYNFDGTMFYPAPEKKYRPYETIEEMYSLLGKVIVERDGTKICLITVVEKWNNNLYINSMIVLRAFNEYTMEDGTPVGVEI